MYGSDAASLSTSVYTRLSGRRAMQLGLELGLGEGSGHCWASGRPWKAGALVLLRLKVAGLLGPR